MFTRAETVSLLVLISKPPEADAKDAASASVVRPLHVTVTAPAGTDAPEPKVTVITLLENADVYEPDAAITPQVLAGAVMRLAGNDRVMVSLCANAVDVVNVTVAEAVPEATAVVMLSAVAAADTQPTHGVDMYVGIESIEVCIWTPVVFP